MNYSLIPTAQAIVQHCQAKNISNIVISPGSRNAPLIIAFTENSFFSCYSIVDERCAAFFALGMAQQLQKPVVVLCTSGSALLNYYPAVAEAYYSNIPLVVISADRPLYKIGIGDGQTINQKNVYENQIGYSANLKQDVTHSTDKILQYRQEWINDRNIDEVQNEVQEYNDSELNRAFNLALTAQCPVHINVPFEEPLYETILEPSIASHSSPVSTQEDGDTTLQLQKDIWSQATKKMVLIGVNAPNSIDEITLKNLANDPSVLVLTETTSNLYHSNFFNSIDSIITPIEMSENPEIQFKALQPEVLVTFGGLIVSKKIKAFLRNFSPEHHWHIGSHEANDTFFCLEEHIKIPVAYFFREMYADTKSIKSNYFDYWNQVKRNYTLKKIAYLEKIPFSDFLVFNEVLKGIPNDYLLQLANSSTIRYTQLFELNPTLKVFCNRGTSGIDGSTSTAIGASIISETPTLLITGDLSFFYDSNALWNNYINTNFRIIVVNNKGGGIFRILPGKENSDDFETYFETRHELNAEHLCSMFGFDYHTTNSSDTLQDQLNSFFDDSGRPKLLEVFTPALINDKILIDYFRFIS
ncbi:2-succinyl-5-enolpyruvyl-6-hydroxy-3-cyclohexene-1-carboxylic-acid synthase [Maribacter sp. ACAM166]|uniref:2-succinyl-5-enolpyruvyl-6-hydroxy-3- cyclohexene-1-carboxylic-acid synthase n=1 Tax=Maribacter sp. ACAM166 TaxID=2508996 RepID=UPI0010FF2095|nr:2-succinyl-5-enolpyruvyl-6-hydroxy-3-cyclohexene-1-carboxylic-acid synthase [Maribacter sp. ACAM166]TLP77589.1 2-succinyl-5-enolpyruvyl-6-hydroxy-3-cyclohexene-1-carboxylic-acid synthase [Maribacter sp. ACAM166]